MELRAAVLLGLLATACAPGGKPAPAKGLTGPAQCIDLDGDGHGRNCRAGSDCDDGDPTITEGCLDCRTPSAGCACERGTPPVACFEGPTELDDGTHMCHEGTRYCRDGQWSECEEIHSYRLDEGQTAAIIDPDAGAIPCNDCNRVCFRIIDDLFPVDGGLDNTSENVDWASGGGLTLREITDAGPPPATDAGTVTIPDCTPGVGDDVDCDGIPDEYDPFPDTPPFATANPAIFLDIAPGEVGTGVIDLEFFINSADVYFLVDQTGSMSEERDQLVADLTTGDYIQDPDFECADYDFDRMPNNELKELGIVGAIRCLIRDAWFGTGFFREIPFSNYANNDHVAFDNYQDITQNVEDVLDAMTLLHNIGNKEWPEASMLALNSLVTGNGMYFGTKKRGVPPRIDCPAGTWGYPCFREGAIPIVVMFTDAMMHNGPTNNDYPYQLSNLGVTAGTGGQYYPLDASNESFATNIHDLGDLTNTIKTFTGDVTGMNADLSADLFGCLGDGDGHDAVFKFSLSQQRDVTISTEGSHFDTVLGVFTEIPSTPQLLPPSNNMNEVGASAFDLGDLQDAFVTINGNTATMNADYGFSDVRCDAHPDSGDAVYKFSLSSDTRIAIDTAGSALDTVVSLHAGPPPVPPNPVTILDTNDDFLTAYDAGEMLAATKIFKGDTSAPLIDSDYSEAQIGCHADSSSADVVYGFELASSTRMRISTEGSSFDTAIGLFDSAASPIASITVPSSNEEELNAYDLGTLDGKIFELSGNTATMDSNFSEAMITCSADDNAPDAVFRFDLNAPTDIEIDSEGTPWDTVVSLHNVPIDPRTHILAGSNYENLEEALDLGDVKDNEFIIRGDTSPMADDYTSAEIGGCSTHNSGEDAAYRFSLSTPTRVRIDANGSSFDTVLALFNAAPQDTLIAVPNTNENEATAFDAGSITQASKILTGNTTGMASDIPLDCSSNPTSSDAVFTFTVASISQYEITTDGTDFDSIIGLYPSTIVETSTVETNVGASNPTRQTAHDMGVMDGLSKRFAGNSSTTGANWSFQHCSSDSGAEDAFFEFSLNSTREIEIDTEGSSYDTVIMLYRYTGPSSYVYETCDHNNFGFEKITRSLNAGTYFIVVKGDRWYDEGAYTLSVKDTSVGNNLIECDDDDGPGSTSEITRTLAPGTYHLVLKGDQSNADGEFELRLRDKTWWDNSSGLIECDDADDYIERDLAAGDYWFVIKGDRYDDEGPYYIDVVDADNPPTPAGPVVCNDDAPSGGSTSEITYSNLPAGSYKIAIKGDNWWDKGPYSLRVKDASAIGSGAEIACDDDSGEGSTSVIERDLAAGSYQVVVKGDAATDEGEYRLRLQDVTNQPLNQLACDRDSGPGESSSLEKDLAAGDYWLIVKGDEATSSAPYTLTLRDADNVVVTAAYCDDDDGSYRTAKLNETLNPGTYYVALKGSGGDAHINDPSDDESGQSGRYQLTVGGGSTSSGSYVPPTWAETLAAVNNQEVRVISILSCYDDPQHGNSNGDCVNTRNQATALANASDALGDGLQPLVFDISRDGTGLSTTVVDAVGQLANYLEMDVTVNVMFEPDENPGFLVSVNAVDVPGDGCSGLVGLEHQNCIPGAAPRFEISFENPLAAPVPLNPNDPNGGYTFRARLIGDGQFVVDDVPIYIIPEDVNGNGVPPPPTYEASGEYWQDSGAPGCDMLGNTAPDWSDLSWDADLPSNTRVTFAACTSDTAQGLEGCTPKQIAEITGTGACTVDADCPVGFCDYDVETCQVPTAGTCTDSVQCPGASSCIDGQCVFPGQPVYVGIALAEALENFRPFIRMSIVLSVVDPNLPIGGPPLLRSWELTYNCTNIF